MKKPGIEPRLALLPSAGDKECMCECVGSLTTHWPIFTPASTINRDPLAPELGSPPWNPSLALSGQSLRRFGVCVEHSPVCHTCSSPAASPPRFSLDARTAWSHVTDLTTRIGQWQVYLLQKKQISLKGNSGPREHSRREKSHRQLFFNRFNTGTEARNNGSRGFCCLELARAFTAKNAASENFLIFFLMTIWSLKSPKQQWEDLLLLKEFWPIREHIRGRSNELQVCP